jgi:ElaB/YqjD/DUF883 family membrane-anchored ribosome-binding protein
MTTDAPRDAMQGVVDDETNARLDTEMRAVKNAMGSLSQQISDAASGLGAVARAQAKRGLRNARANVDAVAADASDRISAAADAAASSIGDTLKEVIVERPLSTVALALGLGFLIGVTWRR